MAAQRRLYVLISDLTHRSLACKVHLNMSIEKALYKFSTIILILAAKSLRIHCITLCFVIVAGVLSFPVLPLSPTTSDISPETLKLLNTCSSKTEASQLEASVENHKVNGGLVTGAPSPPDTKNATCIPQSAIVSQSLVLNNGIEMACGQGTNGVSSPEANSCVEDELTITYQSLPAKNDDKVRS